MKPGKDGCVGGAIYFALNPAETNGKSHHTGVVLQAEVIIGRPFVVHKDNLYKFSPSTLIEQGCDSVIVLVSDNIST